MKSFAFLDVDDTLAYNFRDTNDALINALVEQGITDVYLFTNMSMKNDIIHIGVEYTNMSRYDLIKYMEECGLKVHGVITPADPSYYDENDKLYPIGAPYRQLYEPCYESLQHNPLNLPNGDINPNHDPQAKADFLSNLEIWEEAMENTTQKYGARREKAAMMNMAIYELTAKYGDIGIFYADDVPEFLDHAKEVVQNFNRDNQHDCVLLSTLHVTIRKDLRVANDTTDDEVPGHKKYRAAIQELKLKILLNQLKQKALDFQEKASHAANHNEENYSIFFQAYDHANICYNKLNDLSVQYYSNVIDYTTFKQLSDEAIGEAREELKNHRGCKEILGNIALAIAGLGIVYVAAGLLNLASNGRFLFFKTDSEQKLDAIQDMLNNLSPRPAANTNS